MRFLRNHVLVIAVAAMFVVASGCGTLLYPERRTATASTKMDGTVLIMDCAWLLVGVIPGVVALAVDFSNGAIYFPEEEDAVAPGTDVRANVRGPAPADAWVTLSLLDSAGRELVPSARARVAAGEELDGPLSLRVPDDIHARGARIVLAVNGAEQASRAVSPVVN